MLKLFLPLLDNPSGVVVIVNSVCPCRTSGGVVSIRLRLVGTAARTYGKALRWLGTVRVWVARPAFLFYPISQLQMGHRWLRPGIEPRLCTMLGVNMPLCASSLGWESATLPRSSTGVERLSSRAIFHVIGGAVE